MSAWINSLQTVAAFASGSAFARCWRWWRWRRWDRGRIGSAGRGGWTIACDARSNWRRPNYMLTTTALGLIHRHWTLGFVSVTLGMTSQTTRTAIGGTVRIRMAKCDLRHLPAMDP